MLLPQRGWIHMVLAALLATSQPTRADAPGNTPPAAGFDAALAASLGADYHGMRHYVLVILKTGPRRMPEGADRDAMFRGHFANMKRLSEAGKLALAGPFDGSEGWRGLFIFAVGEIEEARELVATDPVIANGEMVAEFHKYYGSAALMQVKDVHQRIARESF